MFLAALFTIAKIWKQSKCPSVDEWIKKLWYIYTVEYYSAIKKKETLHFTTAWVDLESIMFSKISQSKTNTIWFHLYVESNEHCSFQIKEKHHWSIVSISVKNFALADVAQRIERQPVCEPKVTSLIPSLRQVPEFRTRSPVGGARQPHIDVSLPCFPSVKKLKNKISKIK